MSESRCHMDLVQIILAYIKTIIPPSYHDIIEVDTPDTQSPTPTNGNFIPDVRFCFQENFIIGEAKTSLDFEREHSYKQFDAYLRECICHKGNSKLIVCVPWNVINIAKNYFRKKKKEYHSIPIIILDDIGSSFVI